MSTQARYPQLPPELSGGFNLKMLGFFGAGAIIASVTIGSGETFFASKGGAIFGYALLWVFVASAIMKGIQVYASARFMALTGLHPMQAWGFWPALFFAAISLLCFPFWLSGLPLFIGKTINWIIGIPTPLLTDAANGAELAAYNAAEAAYLFKARVSGTVILVVAAVLSFLQTYKFLELAQTILVGLLLVAMGVACVWALDAADWILVAKGMVPGSVAYPEWYTAAEFGTGTPKALPPVWVMVGTFLGAIGGGTYDYIGYVGCFREKNWGLINSSEAGQPIADDADNVRRGRRWLRPVKIDVGIGFLCVLLFTIVFVALGAKILHPTHLVPDGNELLTNQVSFLTNLSPALEYVYKIGIFMAFFGTIYGAFEIYIRTARESILPLTPRAKNWSMKTFRTIIILYCLIGGLVLMWLNADPQKLVAPAAIVGGVFLCGPWCFAMIWADRKYVNAQLRMGPVLLILTVIAGTVLTLLGVKAILDFEWLKFLEIFMPE